MRFRFSLFAGLVLSVLTGCGDPQGAKDTGPGDIGSINYPVTRRIELTDAQTGAIEPDPYAWLDIAVAAAPEVAEWAFVQNNVTEGLLTSLAGEGASDPLITLADDWGPIMPQMRGSDLFYLLGDARNNVVRVMRAVPNGSDAEEITRLSSEGATTLSWQVSPDGRFASLLQRQGEEATILVADLQAQRLLRDAVPASIDSHVLWHPTTDRFFYTTRSRPGMIALKEHRLGTPDNVDKTVTERSFVAAASSTLHLVGNGGLLAMVVVDPSVQTTSMIGYVFETDETIEPLAPITGRASLLGETEAGLFWLVSTEDNNRIVRIELSTPLPRDWEDVLTSATAGSIEAAALTGGALLTINSEGPSSALTVFTAEGQLQGSFEVPHNTVVTHVGSDDEQGFVTLQFADFIGRRITQVANLQTLSQTIIHASEGAGEPEFLGDTLSVHAVEGDATRLLVLLTEDPGRDLAAGIPIVFADHVRSGGAAAMVRLPRPSPFPVRLATLTEQDELFGAIRSELSRIHDGAGEEIAVYAPGWAGSVALALSAEPKPPFGAFLGEDPLADYLSPVTPGPVPSTEQAIRLEQSPYSRFLQAEPLPDAMLLVDAVTNANATGHAFKFIARRQYRSPETASLIALNPLHQAPVPSPAMMEALAQQRTFIAAVQN